MSVSPHLVGEFLVELFGDRVVQLPVETPRRNPDRVHHLHQHEHPRPEPDPNRTLNPDWTTAVWVTHKHQLVYESVTLCMRYSAELLPLSPPEDSAARVCADRCYPAAPVYTFTPLIMCKHSWFELTAW